MNPTPIYTYVFGLLVALGIYSEYSKCEKSFFNQYKLFLQKSRKNAVEHSCKTLNIDIQNQQFWDQSFQFNKELIEEYGYVKYKC